MKSIAPVDSRHEPSAALRARTERRLESQRSALFKAAGLRRPILVPFALATHATPDQLEALRRVLGQRRLLHLLVIDRALERIANGRFGKCDVCDGNIEPHLLSRAPAAFACGDCVDAGERTRRS